MSVIGCVPPAGTPGMNMARNAVLRPACPTPSSGMTMDRQCASGLMAIATAAKQVMVDNMDVVIGGGDETSAWCRPTG